MTDGGEAGGEKRDSDDRRCFRAGNVRFLETHTDERAHGGARRRRAHTRARRRWRARELARARKRLRPIYRWLTSEQLTHTHTRIDGRRRGQPARLSKDSRPNREGGEKIPDARGRKRKFHAHTRGGGSPSVCPSVKRL